jgi:hypothetical protein
MCSLSLCLVLSSIVADRLPCQAFRSFFSFSAADHSPHGVFASGPARRCLRAAGVGPPPSSPCVASRNLDCPAPPVWPGWRRPLLILVFRRRSFLLRLGCCRSRFLAAPPHVVSCPSSPGLLYLSTVPYRRNSTSVRYRTILAMWGTSKICSGRRPLPLMNSVGRNVGSIQSNLRRRTAQMRAKPPTR